VIRLRQVALVAPDLDPVVAALQQTFGLPVVFHDPGVAEFGLCNALLLVGDQFIEVLAPIADETTAGRLMAKRGGATGYMALYEVDDLDTRVAALGGAGVRTVWSLDLPDIRGRHLHPRDVGGAIVSLDEPVPAGSWRWGGPDWASAPTAGAAVDAITGITLAAHDPETLHRRWLDLGIAESVRFVPAGDRGEGIDGVDLRAVDRSRVGEYRTIGGVEFTLV
jgi:catechol 2,3-dioxygenase-like lactoylglutathione lyase family enzyme